MYLPNLSCCTTAREATRAAEQKMLGELREKLVQYESQALSQESNTVATTNKLQAEVSAAQQAHKLMQESLKRTRTRGNPAYHITHGCAQHSRVE
jgi:hypothetical protein|eukprot:COSAG06_NODE_1059_length_10885_cov_7.620434_8_plen_95_part_00